MVDISLGLFGQRTAPLLVLLGERVGFCDTIGQGTDTPDWGSGSCSVTSLTTTMWMLLPAAYKRQMFSLPEKTTREIFTFKIPTAS